MKETATTTSLGSIGQITEDHELIVDVHAEDEIVGKPDAKADAKLDVKAKANSENKAEAAAYADSSDRYEDDDADEIVDSYADSWSYEVPRPWLTVDQAASMLGRSTRGVERSILGRWGNHLPEGWSARRVRIDGIDEWRIIPPPGFRIKHSRRETTRRDGAAAHIEDVEASPVSGSEQSAEKTKSTEQQPTNKSQEKKMASPANTATAATPSANEPFSLEKFLQSAGKMAQKELASFGLSVRPTSERGTSLERAGAIDADIEHATIVIDRSDEVEKLLRELANSQKELA